MTTSEERRYRALVDAVDANELVQRPRLTKRLVGRFDHRVTTVVAPAGSGKTAALTLAIRNNQLDPAGLDVWLDARQSDNDPVHLLAAIAQALGVGTILEEADGTGRIHDAVWSHAPLDVAIVIDDVHEITARESLDVLASITRDLPANGHLVLASRSVPDVPLARFRAQRQLLELVADDLEFDDRELEDLRAQRGVPSASPYLPRHAATADLQLAVGSAASIEFLCQEVLAGLEPDRLAALRWAALHDELDDHLVGGLSDGRFDVASLVAGLPLIDKRDDGGRRMHSLLRDALVSGLEPSDRRKGLEMAAELEVHREHFAAAVRLYHDAGHDVAARQVARQFVMAPSLRQTISDITAIRRIVATIDPDSALLNALEASLHFGGLPHEVVPLFRATAEAAAREGDVQLEALALHRLNQAGYLGMTPLERADSDRMRELARAGGFAAGAAAHLRSGQAQLSGDIDAALAALDEYHHFGPLSGALLRAERLCDLGHPERAAIGVRPEDLDAMPEGTEIFTSLAMWLRGDADPESAQAIVTAMLPDVTRRGATHPIVSMLGVGTVIALAAGDDDSARRRARQVRELCDLGVGDTSSLFANIAAAAVASVDDGDDAAARLLDPAVTGFVSDVWPMRAHLVALALVYVALPQSRAALDAAALGPALSTAVAAGRALVELRTTGSVDEALRLPWTRVNVLRVHVLPPHLAELACAAADAGNSDAASLLLRIPNLSANLARVEASAAVAPRRHASRVLGDIPREPPATLSALLLGMPRLVRDGEPVRSSDWQRRPAIRELCALLLERRRVHRVDVMGLVWPEHADEAKTNANLRSLLSVLQRVLEPGRDKATEPFFLRTDGDLLVMDAAVRTDVDRFETLMTSALSDDQAGSPSSALASYLEALELYGGDFVEGSDAAWLVMTRLRLRALASSAMCRVSELIAAGGEPEEAARWAQRARTLEPLDQRAGRLFVAALDASGQRTSSLAAADELLATLNANGLAVESATRRLVERLRR